MSIKKAILYILVVFCLVLIIGCRQMEQVSEDVAEKVTKVAMTPTEVKVQCVAITSNAQVWSDSAVAAVSYGEMSDWAITYGINRVLIFEEFHKGEYRRYDVVGIYVKDLKTSGILKDFPKGIEKDADGIVWFHDGEATPF